MEAQVYNAEYTIRVSNADIKLYQMVYFPKKEYTVHHIHSHFELHYITEGSVIYTMDFQKEIELHTGEWLLINKNVYHEEIITGVASGYVLGFELKNMEKKSFFSSLETIPYHKGGMDPEMGEWMAQILYEAGEQRPEYASFCKIFSPSSSSIFVEASSMRAQSSSLARPSWRIPT